MNLKKFKQIRAIALTFYNLNKLENFFLAYMLIISLEKNLKMILHLLHLKGLSFSFTTYFIIHWSTNKRTSCGPNIILTLILRRHLFLFLSCILLSPLCTNCDHKVPLLAEKYLNWYLLSYFPIVLAVDISFSHSIVHFGLINNSVQIGPRILPTYLFFTNQK